MEHPTPLCLLRNFHGAMVLDDREAIGGCEVCFVSVLPVVETQAQVFPPIATQEIGYLEFSVVGEVAMV
jgi:hypothetical protein